MPEIAPFRRSQNGEPSVFQLLLQRFDAFGQANLAEAEAVQGEPDQHDADEAEHERDAISADMPPSRTTTGGCWRESGALP